MGAPVRLPGHVVAAARTRQFYTMESSVRVYVNGDPVDVAATATAFDAITQWNAEAAAEIHCGSRVVVDNRGLPTPADTPVYWGAIFRVVSSRQARASDSARIS